MSQLLLGGLYYGSTWVKPLGYSNRAIMGLLCICLFKFSKDA